MKKYSDTSIEQSRICFIAFSFLIFTLVSLQFKGFTQEIDNSMRRTNVKGIPIAFQKVGAGTPLVLLHGFTQDSRIWKLQIENLSKNFTVVAWDAPGAGQSADPSESFDIGEYADCLKAFLDSVGVKKAHMLGLSWGGLLAQEFFFRYPTYVISLALADTYAGWTGSLSDSIARARLASCIKDSSLPPSEFVSKYLSGMFSDSPPKDAKEDLAKIMFDTHPLGFRLMATALAIADTRRLLPTINVPTILIWGDADKRSPINVAHQLHSLIPNSKLVIISNAGHVSNMEKSEEFNKIVREFCIKISSK